MALDDIRLALESGYPDDLKFKLIDRKVLLIEGRLGYSMKVCL